MKKLINLFYRRKGLALQQAPPNAFDEQQRLLGKQQPSVIFDVGGHYGETVHEYRRRFPAATIYSFEPFPESFVLLEQASKRYQDVHATQAALSDKNGEAEFSVNENSATNSLLAVSGDAPKHWRGLVETRGATRVPTVTLDSYCASRGIDSIDILKLDVQGGEPLVLRGAERMLGRGAIRLVYVEIITVPCYAEQLQLDQCLSMMRKYGFSFHNFYDLHSSQSGQLKQCDAIFIRRNDRDFSSEKTTNATPQSNPPQMVA
jgi:FkbM family methyltransferase